MPPTLITPGVYIQEVASGVRTIVSVATSITTFIGRARRGPTDEPRSLRSFAEFERIYGGLWEPAPLGYAVQHFFANGGGEAVIARVHNLAESATLALTTFNLVAVNAGAWGNQLRVRVDHDTENPSDTTLFNIAVSDLDSRDTEHYLNVSVMPDHPRYIVRVLEGQSQLIRVDGPVGDIRPAANAPLLSLGADPFAAASSTPFNSGDDGNDITQNDIIDPLLEEQQRGLWMFDQVSLFNLMVIPPLNRATDVPPPVWNRAAAYCADRRAVLIVDSPAAWDTPEDVVGGIGDFDAVASAAIYFPRIMAPDPLKDFRRESFAPSGAIAGVIARTDAERGVWKAPAGLGATMAGVSALSRGGKPGLLSDQQMGILNRIGVNCLRTMPNTGHVVWGSRTRRGADNLASEWKYLSVRRLAYYIEESLYRGTEWAAFEPNDEPLWAQLRLNCGAFMQGLFRHGALQGTSPRDAYFVKCSRETTTQADIDAGIVNMLIGFAPLKPAEFIVLRIQQMKQQ